jgi:hypothetical protein
LKLWEKCAKGKDCASHGGLENLEAENLRGRGNDLGLRLTGMANRCGLSTSTMRVQGVIQYKRLSHYVKNDSISILTRELTEEIFLTLRI